MSLGLDMIFRLISLSGHSIFSLIDDILARGECEDEEIKLLREGITRDAVDICALLLSHKPASTSISAWALAAVQPTLLSVTEDLSRRVYDKQNEIAASPGLSSGASSSWASFGDSERVFGRVQCTCSSSVRACNEY